jgi:hypothetical protein
VFYPAKVKLDTLLTFPPHQPSHQNQREARRTPGSLSGSKTAARIGRIDASGQVVADEVQHGHEEPH